MRKSHGSGAFERSQLRLCPDSVVIEPGALIFHPENVSLGEDVYVGHYAILKGYHRNQLVVGERSWIGQGAFLHAGGGIVIGRDVGIAPGVKILTSWHEEAGIERPIMEGPLAFAPVTIEDNSDIGIGAILLPGVTIGAGAQVGAGAVVTKSVEPLAVVAGNPARELRKRR